MKDRTTEFALEHPKTGAVIRLMIQEVVRPQSLPGEG